MNRGKIPENVQAILKAHGQPITLQAGEILCRQGDPSDAVYFVVDGSLTVHAGDPDRYEEFLLNYIMPGEITGEIGAITGLPRSATLTADQPTTLIQLSTQEFQTILHKAPTLAKLVVETVASHLASADADRVTLGRSYQQMQKRISALDEEKEQLQELLRLREEMEAMIVHDLQNPLCIIQAGLRLLEPVEKEVEDQDTFVKIVALMDEATKRLRLLVKTLMDITKMEAGKSILYLTDVDLSDLVATLVNEQQALASQNRITLVTDVPAQCIVRGDRDVLYRVLVNLVDNALKFSPRGGHIRIAVDPADEHGILIGITDSGPGVPPEERERIFEKFTQIRDGEHIRRRGTGLGLTFCRMAVEAHDGQIWVEPGEGNAGSSFRFRLPHRSDAPAIVNRDPSPPTEAKR